MTKLPVLQPYNEALKAFAKDWIKGHCAPNGVFHPDANEIYGKELMKHWMQVYPSFGPDDVLYLCENGNEQAYQALRELAGEYEQRGEPKPTSVGQFTVRVLNNSDRRRDKKPGPGKTDNFVRDFGITLLVGELKNRFGLKVYKNRESTTRPTASTIAALALTEAGIGISISYKGVEKIWQRFGPILIGKFPAGYLGPYGA
jgi:hypothetical protein